LSNIKQFGAAGDGQRDDTAAIEHAIAAGDGLLELPRGTYRVTRTIEIDLARHGWLGVAGRQGTARLLMAAAGPALRLVGHHQGTAVPDSVQPAVWDRERFPIVSTLEVMGDHPEADGIELIGTMQPTIDRVLLRRLRHGLVLRERNRNVIVTACHIYDNSGYGVYFDQCNLHQTIISGCHISYNRLAGIRSRGGDLHNLQITGNDIEYNFDAAGHGAADIWFETLSDKASEITIASNTIQAVVSPGGANVRITGLAESPPRAAPLIAITGNVLGSQETNIDLAHADRVLITGNALYDGKLATIRAADCRHLLIANNTFGWNAPADREMAGGIRLERCEGVNITGLILNDDRAGDEREGAAIAMIDCADSAVSNCQVLDPRWRGLWLANCRRVRVSDNSILDRRQPPAMLSAIQVAGGAGNLIQNNLVGRGRDGGVLCPPDAGTVVGNVESA
jgi:hypothetical protein